MCRYQSHRHDRARNTANPGSLWITDRHALARHTVQVARHSIHCSFTFAGGTSVGMSVFFLESLVYAGAIFFGPSHASPTGRIGLARRLHQFQLTGAQPLLCMWPQDAWLSSPLMRYLRVTCALILRRYTRPPNLANVHRFSSCIFWMHSLQVRLTVREARFLWDDRVSFGVTLRGLVAPS